MHMSDALISPVVGAVFTTVTVATNVYCIKKIKTEENSDKMIPLMGVMGAFVFACQMINITIPGTGSSGHIMGDLLLCTILGPYATYITMSAILLIQALFFADGGLLAFGANVFNMAFFTCFLLYPLVYKPIINRKNGKFMKNLLLATLITKILGEELGALFVVIETALSFKITMPIPAFFVTMETIHLFIGILEGIITYGILSYIYKEKEELIYENSRSNENANTSLKTLIPFMVASLFIGGALSVVASSKPDGLEWSLAKYVDEEDLETNKNISVFDDYEVGSENLSESARTSIAGIVGTTVTLVIAFGVWRIIVLRKRVKKNESAS